MVRRSETTGRIPGGRPAAADGLAGGAAEPARAGRAVFARHAASLIVVRDAGPGPEVLMGVRGAGHRFMPNRLVFPGGAVDPADATAAAASEPDPALLAILRRSAQPRLARGIVVCAARELQEETGLTLGTPPHLSGLEYLCRAVTPPWSPMRFNARFLVVDAEKLCGTAADSHELQDVRFRRVSDVMAEDLVFATREVLTRFIAWHAAAERPPPMVLRKRRWEPER